MKSFAIKFVPIRIVQNIPMDRKPYKKNLHSKKNLAKLIEQLEYRKTTGNMPVCYACKKFKINVVYAKCGHICCESCLDETEVLCGRCALHSDDEYSNCETEYDYGKYFTKKGVDKFRHPGLSYHERFFGSSVLECDAPRCLSGITVVLSIIIFVVMYMLFIGVN